MLDILNKRQEIPSSLPSGEDNHAATLEQITQLTQPLAGSTAERFEQRSAIAFPKHIAPRWTTYRSDNGRIYSQPRWNKKFFLWLLE